jgi:CheY-like chemotaxis protein
MSSIKVLIVEDEPVISFVMEDIINNLGYEVVAKTATLSESEQVAASIDVNLAILDINLYGKTTYALAEILLNRGIPFIFVTGHQGNEMPKSLSQTIKISKPFSSSDISSAIAKAMSQDER